MLKAKIIHFFLAAVLSVGLFAELKMGAFPRIENDNAFPWALFVCIDTENGLQIVPPNWRCRALSMKLSAEWAQMLHVQLIAKAAGMDFQKDTTSLVWAPKYQDMYAFAFASYNALIYLFTCIILIFLLENPILPMLGTFASILMSAPTLHWPYILPWDMPTMAAWTFIFWIYSILHRNQKAKSWWWICLPFVIGGLGLLKETVLVTALFLIGAPWSWPKRIGAIVLTVIGSQMLNWWLFAARPDWMFSVSSAAISGGHHWNPLMLWPIVLANAGSITLMPWLLWKKRDWPLAAVCGVFIVLQALNNLACGVYDENRDWLELAPIGWLLISDYARGKMAKVSVKTA
jgi:hypothetical protein